MRISAHDQVRNEVEKAMQSHLRSRRRTIRVSLVVLPTLAGLALATSGTLAKLAAGGLVVYVVLLALLARGGTFSQPDEESHYKFTLAVFFGKSIAGTYTPKTIFAIFQKAMLVEGWQRDPIERTIIRACQNVREVYNNCAPVHGQEPFEWPSWATADLAQLSTSELIRWADARRTIQTEIALMRNAANN